MLLFCLVAALPLSGAAAVHEVRVPLQQGRLTVGTLSRGLARVMHAPGLEIDSNASIDLSGVRGMLWIKAFNAALGDGCRIEAASDALVLSADPQKLPRSLGSVKEAIRLFTAAAAPEATAAQRRQYGLHLPSQLSADRPLVVLVHGLDCDGSDWSAMAELLERANYQVAYFRYPNDESVVQSSNEFARQMVALRQAHPKLTVDVVTHSMGGLVARGYIEGNRYEGGIRHLVLIAPPNHGSTWAMFRLLLEVHEHYELWRHNPQWHWTWMITDGLGEAGSDLMPGSRLLASLNDGPRRQGVRYTIIAGSHTPWQKWERRSLNAIAKGVPDSIENWWGIRQGLGQIRRWSSAIKQHNGQSDGVVSIQSARLPGVSDVVVLPVDHEALYCGTGGPPAAWPVVADRLGR